MPSSQTQTKEPAQELRPLERQERFLASSADLAIYGGAAGGGKSWALLMEPCQYLEHYQGADWLILRRTYPEIKAAGGLWEQSFNLYPHYQGTPNQTELKWTFPGKNSIRFSHLEHRTDLLKFQGSQYVGILFDELTHFSLEMFFYLKSRNRSLSGLNPYMRATTNPDPDSWVRQLLEPFLDSSGYPQEEKTSRHLWFIQRSGKFIFREKKKELLESFPEERPLSLEFIPAMLEDNVHLTRANPDYRTSLMSLPEHERKKLLYGNWFAKDDRNRIFFLPARGQVDYSRPVVGYLDTAYTDSSSSDYTALTVGYKDQGKFFVVCARLYRLTLDQVYSRVIEDLRQYNLTSLVVEANAAQRAIADEFRRRGLSVRNVINTKAKSVRIQSHALKNWSQTVFGPNVDQEYLAQIEDYTLIPPAKHDDAADSLAGFIEIFQEQAQSLGQMRLA